MRTGAGGGETRLLVRHAFELARALGLRKIVVDGRGALVRRHVEATRGDEEVVWLSDVDADPPVRREDRVVALPAAELTPVDRLTLGLFVAVLQDDVRTDEAVVCLSGLAARRRTDAVVLVKPRRDFPWFRQLEDEASKRLLARPTCLRALDVCLRLSAEGREGKPVGTVLVVGDLEAMRPHLRQLILNPCKGHPKRLRNLHAGELVETVRELAALDGALVIGEDGVLESAGTYLDAPSQRVRPRSGQGARHLAAAAFTAATDATAFVLSESSGSVSVFHRGRTILHLERPSPRTDEGRGG